ncbi:hypothetical protein [Vallitalea okinawensis]|uniref:hypothetical protein n=1 Tax=Vallitalea okinawensis TaxID=2078660 RepID=UPI000CFD6F6F|nr:hypothetical protein [Vallitalea okinawensis]
MKTSIIIAGNGAGLIVGAVSGLIIRVGVAVFPINPWYGAGIIAFAASVEVGGAVLITKGQDWLYEEYDIK